MGTYKTAQICLNGHIITDNLTNYAESGEKFCSACGAETITKCPKCSAMIRGYYEMTGIVSLVSMEKPPSYCYNCGTPYPWTQKAIEVASLIIKEEENFSDDQKSSLVEILPDVISETPKTNLAVIRMKKAFSHAGKFTAETIRQFIIDFGCELAIKSLGL